MKRDQPQALGLVAAGGVLGSLARWGVSTVLPHTPFAWHTFAVNVVGALVIGALFGATTSADRNARLFVGTGILGGFTTFSAFAFDIHLAATDQSALVAGAYAGSTVVLGLAAAAVGLASGRRWRRATER